MKTVRAIRHVHFEDLGSFADILEQQGFEIQYEDFGDLGFPSPSAHSADLLVILGGPVGVYEAPSYPMLADEIRLVSERLAAGRPTLGICLGAQIMAAALGSTVRPTGFKEIGFARVALTEAGRRSPLRHLDGVDVLHWHGDAYDLPPGAENLATTPMTRQQAFRLGPNVLAVQFHPELSTGAPFERWLVGHAVELAGAGVDVTHLREDARQLGSRLQESAGRLLSDWLSGLST